MPFLFMWRRVVVVITTAQLYSTKPELRFCTGSISDCGVLEICNGEDLWQWSRMEIRLNVFRRSTIPQKQFIIIIIIILNVTFFQLLLGKYPIQFACLTQAFCESKLSTLFPHKKYNKEDTTHRKNSSIHFFGSKRINFK